jgi:hypothetical protein
MRSPVPAPLLAALVLAPTLAVAAPADRHPGLYQFRNLPPGDCARAQNQRRSVPRVRKLGDLPPAYRVLTTAQTTAPPLATPFAFQRDAPCSLLERIL